MPMLDSDIRKLQPAKTKYVRSAGEGVLVEVHPQGYKYFKWEYKFPPGKNGKRKTYHLGRFGKDSEGLWSRRRAIDEKRRLDILRKDGHDPQLLKSTEKKDIEGSGSYTFRKVADEWIGSQSSKLSESTIRDYRNKLDNQILPKFGNYLIKNITRSECISFWKSHVDRDRAPQANKLLMVMRLVFGYAIDHEWIEDSNPARSSKATQSGHKSTPQPSLEDWDEVPPFLVALSENKCGGDMETVAAVKLAALTFVRASTLVSAKWSDIDWDKKIWTIPDYDMKGRSNTGKDHLTPMSTPVVDLLRKLQSINGDHDYVFFSQRGKKHPYLNPSSPNHHITNLGYKGRLVTHGFRAMVMTHAQEILKVPFHIIDLQLGHIKGDKVRQAYDRAQFLSERTDLMDRWGDLLLENGLRV